MLWELLHELGIYALLQQERGASVTQIVEAGALREPGVLERVFEGACLGCHRIWVYLRTSETRARVLARAYPAGTHRVEVEDFDFGYGLYADGVRVASFALGRVGYRQWARRNGKLGDIHSRDDRLDHNVDQLMG
jgi:hypothetical protein